MRNFRSCVLAVVMGLFAAAPALATPVFVDWTSFTASGVAQNNGSAQGTLTFGSEVISVQYAGGVYSGGGTTTTTAGTALYASCATFTPCISITDNISNDGGAGLRHTVTFSSAVFNPHFHIASMGQSGVPIEWSFDDPFTILSGSLTHPSGNVVRGVEGFGSIAFSGAFTQLSWVSSGAENTTGFTISADQVQVPEPATLALLGLGLAGIGVSRRKKA